MQAADTVCARLASFDAANADAVRRAFADAVPLAMQQAWRVAPEDHFAPATVRTGWRDQSLLIFAELTDADVFTTATEHNQRLCEIGDAFEVFLRPVGQDAYAEFHVAPNNLQMQLHFPDAGWRDRVSKEDAILKALMPLHSFQSHTWLDAAAGRWCVLAEIPSASVCDQPGPLAGTAWRFSFSRYDYTRGREAPVISSTSPHAVARFHRQEEWGLLRFQP